MGRRQKKFDLRPDIVDSFERIAGILGLKQYEAAEAALSDWAKKHGDEAQKKLDAWAGEKGISIRANNVTVNIAVFQKAEIQIARKELRLLLDILDSGSAEYREDTKLKLAKTLKTVQPVYMKTRDPELEQLIQEAESHL